MRKTGISAELEGETGLDAARVVRAQAKAGA